MVKILYLIKAFLRNSFLANTLVELQGVAAPQFRVSFATLTGVRSFSALRARAHIPELRTASVDFRNHKIRKILKKGATPQDCQREGLHVNFNTKSTRRCVELFVTLGFAHEKPTHLRCVQRTACIFNASTLSLVPSRSLAQWKTLLRKFFPKHADGTLTQSM